MSSAHSGVPLHGRGFIISKDNADALSVSYTGRKVALDVLWMFYL